MAKFPKIVSGGQTGADRAALDWALSHNLPCGGWCPKGWKSRGTIDPKYPLKESSSASYRKRPLMMPTYQNHCVRRTQCSVIELSQASSHSNCRLLASV